MVSEETSTQKRLPFSVLTNLWNHEELGKWDRSGEEGVNIHDFERD